MLRPSLLLLPAPAQPQRIITVPFEVRVPNPPTAVGADGKIWLNYELHITNLFPRDFGIRSVDVLEDGSNRSLQSLDPDALGKGLQRIGASSRDSLNSRVIASGRRSVLFVWVPIGSGSAIPAAVRHRIIAVRADSLETAAPDTLLTGSVPVGRVAPILASPLKGGPWVAVNGPGNTSGHRRTMIPLDGTPGSRSDSRPIGSCWVRTEGHGRATRPPTQTGTATTPSCSRSPMDG